VPEAAGPSAGVATAAGVHAAATAELAVGLILAKLRGIDAAVRDQQTGSWRPQRRASLADRRVLLLGVGGIGHEIAKRLAPFEVELTRVGSSARTDEHGEVHAASDLVSLAASHDVLVAENALITPHIGGNASAFEPRIVKLLAQQLEALANGNRPANLVQEGPFSSAG
jgi:phosphoglycerate dehydrogenase-like enzyme